MNAKDNMGWSRPGLVTLWRDQSVQSLEGLIHASALPDPSCVDVKAKSYIYISGPEFRR